MDFQSFVLAASTDNLAETDDPVVQARANAVEYRMDLASKPLESLSQYDGTLPVIATNRVEWEGGKASDTEDRIAKLKTAAANPAVGAVDIELEAIKRGDADPLLSANHVKNGKTSVIVSVHDFDRTPQIEDLRDLLDQALEYGNIGKLAVTANGVEDVPPLLTVTREFAAQGQKVATMAMGEAGSHSRAVAPLYGSTIGYAPAKPGQATAPGQLDLTTLASLIETLS